MRTQLGNEQNNIDAYMKHRNMTEIILGMRKHVEILMAAPEQRLEGMEEWAKLKYSQVPCKKTLDPRFEAELKKRVFERQKLALDKKNTYWASWNISMQSHDLFKQLERGAVFL